MTPITNVRWPVPSGSTGIFKDWGRRGLECSSLVAKIQCRRGTRDGGGECTFLSATDPSRTDSGSTTESSPWGLHPVGRKKLSRIYYTLTLCQAVYNVDYKRDMSKAVWVSGASINSFSTLSASLYHPFVDDQVIALSNWSYKLERLLPPTPHSVLEITVGLRTLSDHFGHLSDPKMLGSDIWPSTIKGPLP